jgi:hypothetical protein
MDDTVRGITATVSKPPADGRLRVAGLPRLGLDRGIHLEAALQLGWNDPSVRLEPIEGAASHEPGVLLWRDGRITTGTTE